MAFLIRKLELIKSKQFLDKESLPSINLRSVYFTGTASFNIHLISAGGEHIHRNLRSLSANQHAVRGRFTNTTPEK